MVDRDTERDSVRDVVLRIGTVSGIDGRRIHIAVDKNKNSSSLLLGGKSSRTSPLERTSRSARDTSASLAKPRGRPFVRRLSSGSPVRASTAFLTEIGDS